ncbi:hypothetical protein [Methylobacterium sp. J-070]|uniref:hypothetical protein n=1 Tax=Methylobacterium sp. J-070 TaxID=2836650 RepID=UPI001FB9D45E|nr:hypothetical protein [Methylobacterium sp. J-070]MCJ2052802.1 hypothetical protein [Methylobacterium sp. J-070]
MSEPLTIPPWVPNGVRLMYEVGPLKNECSRRLLTDTRMKAAWTQLRNLVPASDAPTPTYYQPSPYMQERVNCIGPGCDLQDWELDEDLTDFDRLSAALYYEIVGALSQTQEPVSCTTAEAEAWAKPYFDAAKICDLQIKVESAWKFKEDLITALEKTRAYLLEQGHMRRMASNPRVLDRRSDEDSDKLRAQVRSVAVASRDLFGPFAREFPHAAVARIAVVSLNRTDAIDKALKNSVARWCENLPPR